MPFCAPSPAAPGGSCSPPFTLPRYNYATEVVRQVVGQQTGSDNWLETSGYGTCGVRQVVGDNWRKHGWLATRGFSHIDLGLSAVNMTLPAFAAERCACFTAIDRYLLPVGQSSANPQLLRSISRTDGRTDARPFHRPCSVHYAASVNKMMMMIM